MGKIMFKKILRVNLLLTDEWILDERVLGVWMKIYMRIVAVYFGPCIIWDLEWLVTMVSKISISPHVLSDGYLYQ